MSRFLNGIKSFVHSISTSDHYAAYDPVRPAGQEDTAPLASSRDDRRSSSSSLGKSYVPGMRSAQMSSSSVNLARASTDAGASGTSGIPLADMTPIPSAELSWNRIDTWIEHNYPELYDQLLEGATSNDLNDLEHDLDCALPQDVRESFEVHDGQEPGAKPTGVFFGIALLDLEGISEEWNVWRRAALKVEELLHRRRVSPGPGPSSSRHGGAGATALGSQLAWIEQQRSYPPGMIQGVYAHPSWIPLAKDFDGNNIAVDLAPGPKGRYGQVILFGRDFDTKYVVAPSWGDFLAQFAADLESGQSFIDEDIENAVFAFKLNGQLVSYFNVLRRRVERAHPPRPQTPQQQPHSHHHHHHHHHHPPQAQPYRRSMANTSVSHAPVNSGRVTPRLISPTNSSTSLPLKDPKSKSKQRPSITSQLNEIDLNEAEDSGSSAAGSAAGSRKPSAEPLVASHEAPAKLREKQRNLQEVPLDAESAEPPKAAKAELSPTDTAESETREGKRDSERAAAGPEQSAEPAEPVEAAEHGDDNDEQPSATSSPRETAQPAAAAEEANKESKAGPQNSESPELEHEPETSGGPVEDDKGVASDAKSSSAAGSGFRKKNKKKKGKN